MSDDGLTLTICDECGRAYPLREMTAIVSGTGLTHWYRYRCRECIGKGADDE